MRQRVAIVFTAVILSSCANRTVINASVASDGGALSDGGSQSVPTTASIPIDGDPNGLYWDDPSQTLYIADDDNNRVLTYTDAAGISKLADLPAAPANGPGLGQITRLADGSLLVTRFGYGTTGDVAIVKPDKTSSIVPNLDPTKRRIGIAVAPDETIYDGYFLLTGSGYVGSVAKLDLSGVETDVATGLTKTVGVLATSDTLFFDDQAQGKLFSTPRATPGTLTAVADLPDADLMCQGPNGAFFSGGADGNVREIDAHGVVTVFATGFAAARGVAYDPTHARLFIANHVGTAGANTVEVRPVP